MRFFSAPPLVLLLGIGLAAPLAAEQLQMPAEGQDVPQSQSSMEMPVKGMSKQQVEQIYGEPRQRLAPVGDPPISRWAYEHYTVYFEYSHVIHSVANR